jgi:hypothetical protein
VGWTLSQGDVSVSSMAFIAGLISFLCARYKRPEPEQTFGTNLALERQTEFQMAVVYEGFIVNPKNIVQETIEEREEDILEAAPRGKLKPHLREG